MSGVPWSTVSVQREAGGAVASASQPLQIPDGSGYQEGCGGQSSLRKALCFSPSDLEKGPPEGGRLELGPDFQTSSSRICCVALSKSFPSLDLSCHTCSRRIITGVLSTFPRESRHTAGLFGHSKAGEGLQKLLKGAGALTLPV